MDMFGEPNKLLANGVLLELGSAGSVALKTIFGHGAMTLIRVTQHRKKITLSQ